ncbi:MAG: putative DNA modification/repair radical SAM protein [Lachnospiraceae bacterium]|nr:putative DNA modification/repair radical SAM protein [Lachnospiraceae bacterium]
MDIMEKLQILADSAKYDVACTSSGSNRKGAAGAIGNSVAPGICHTFSADGRCISLLKILYTNHCIFDCKYCINRSSNDVVRTSFTPEEVCTLTIEFYRRNYIEGLFLSSGIHHTPNETMAEIVQTLMLLREKYHFNGYIHCKAIPGADPDLIELAGWYADRMSVNLELPTTEGLRSLAPHKNRKNILLPMRQIQSGMEENMLALGVNDSRGRYWYTARELGRKEEDTTLHLREQFRQQMSGQEVGSRSLLNQNMEEIESTTTSELVPDVLEEASLRSKLPSLHMKQEAKWANQSHTGRFVPAGQSTQMIIGATKESDYQILSVSEALYKKFDLKRVFYSAFVRVNDDSALPVVPGGPPLLREHRLYQADWLLRYYGFEAKELLSEQQPNFNEFLDPKCDWALRHPEQFPVEINRADYYTLLRVPGIGVKSARRIVQARKTARLEFSDLKKVGVVLKRAIYFITCGGSFYYSMKITEGMMLQNLLLAEKLPKQEDTKYQQLSLFDGTYRDFLYESGTA